jgi:Collagen triple helix repeat (20 copies)
MRKNLKIILALTTASLLISVVYATSFMNPTTQYTGEGEPVGTNFREGDTYIDTVSLNMWIFNGTSWVTFARLMQPPVNGINGTDGTDGSTWFFVTQDPTTLPEFGKDGDFCLDSNVWNVWYKSNGQWQIVGNIKGADGTNGIDGINGTDGLDGKDGIDGADGIDSVNGSTWYNDLAFTFSEDLGSNGDYFMFTNGTVEYKMDGQWVYFTSLMGPTGATGGTGATGATGATGPAGSDGVDGVNGINGKDGVNGTDGVDGKDGIDASLALSGTNGTDGVVPWWMYVVAVVALGASGYSVNKSRKKTK